MMEQDKCTCEYCGKTGTRYDRFGQEVYKFYENHMLCINHYSQAKWPETYTETPEILDWL